MRSRKKFRRSPMELSFDAINSFLMLALIVATLYPFLYVVFASLSVPSRLAGFQGFLLGPKGVSLSAYTRVIRNPMILIGYKNTLIYVVFGTTLNVFITSLGAYVLSRRRLFFKNYFTVMIVFTMFFGGGLIPLYLVVKNLNMIDTRWAMIIPSAISTWNLIIMRTGFYSVPYELEESAKMDGANDFFILFRIYLPLSLPVVAVMVLFYGVAHWNSFFDALIYLRNKRLYPLQLILREILILSSLQDMDTDLSAGDREPVGETIKYATIVVTILPIIMLYPLLQRYFVKGIRIGALKG